jgi:hypothetical protein
MLWIKSSDPRGVGPILTRQRQLYDLVRQTADQSTGREGQQPFILTGLGLDSGSTAQPEQGITSQDNQSSTNDDILNAVEKERLTSIRLVEASAVLSSSAILQDRDLKR